MPDGMEKNMERVNAELSAYKDEVVNVILPGIRMAPSVARSKGRNVVLYTLHKTTAFIEEWYDKCPRVNAYLFQARAVLFWPPVIYLACLGARTL